MRRPRTVAATVKRRPKYVVAGLAPGKVVGGIKKRGPGPEEVLHRDVAKFLRHALRPDECLWFHVPNGGARTAAEGGILKAMGVMAGIPDLLFLRAGRLYAIELKSATGKPSPTQEAVMIALESHGVETRVCTSIECVEDALWRWAFPLHARTRTTP